MNNNNYIKILNTIYAHYGIDESEFIKLLKNRDKKFLILLLLKNNNFCNSSDLINILGISSESKMKRAVRSAERKFLINSFFRKDYVELEEKIKKQID